MSRPNDLIANDLLYACREDESFLRSILNEYVRGLSSEDFSCLKHTLEQKNYD